MPAIHFKRFAKRQVLRAIGRDLLEVFLERFRGDLPPGTVLPEGSLTDDAYFEALTALLMNPERLPESMTEVLVAIDEMATPEGQERLEAALADAGRELDVKPRATRQEIALQAWLAAPELLARKHNEQRMLRLTRFEHFGSALPAGSRRPFAPPAPEAFASLPDTLDGWFARHHRGQQTARVDLYQLNGEHWFLVRHGDTFTRAPSVERRRTEIIHYRPERDDLVVYSPAHDEIRLHARTKGERELYRRQFGLLLRDDPEYFSARLTYTLEPLRRSGSDALRADGLEAIRKVTLRELEVVSDNGNDEYKIYGGRDLFARAGFEADGIPHVGRLTRAAFEIEFEGCRRKRRVEICPPNVLKLGPHCDPRVVDGFCCRRGFRVAR